jgi:hypothetical protein
MTYNYLGVITSESKTEEKDGVLAINTDISDYPFLEYRKDESWVPIDNYGDLNRMARFEDLYTSLYEREWGIGSRLLSVIDKGNKQLYMMTDKYDSPIPMIKKSDKKFLVSKSSDPGSLEDFDKLYTILMKIKSMTDIKEIDLGNDYYRYLVSTRNLIDQSSVIDLYSYSEDSTDYGNILNLNELLQKRDIIRYQKGNYTIRVEILYVKSGSRMSGTFIFDPFVFDHDGNLNFNNFQSKINDDITVEVKNGCIRVFPDVSEISECILSHCYLVYGKLL